MASVIDSPESKKAKKSSDNTTVLYNFSHILSQCFHLIQNTLKCYFYQIKDAPLFGILLPLEYPGCELLTFLEILMVDIEFQSALRKFQHEMWSDLFKASKEPIGRVSEANYFVVPLEGHQIDWTIINRGIGQQPLLKLKDFLSSSRGSLILKTSHKTLCLWKYVHEMNHNTPLNQFVEYLYGKDYPKNQELQVKFSGYDPLDIIFDESFTHSSAKEFRNLISSGIIEELSENTPIIFAKQLKSIRNTISSPSSIKIPKILNLLPMDLVDVFYLDSNQWEQTTKLLRSLIMIENYSFVIEFSQKFSYSSSFSLINSVMSSISTNNYENCQIIGHLVCRLLIILANYFQNPQNDEHTIIENCEKQMLIDVFENVGRKFELNRFFKTNSIKIPGFRPAFYASKEIVTESYSIEHVITDEIIGKFVKSLIGGFCVSTGLKSACEFLQKLGILYEAQVKSIKNYLTDDGLNVVFAKNPVEGGDSLMREIGRKFRNLSLEEVIDYEFIKGNIDDKINQMQKKENEEYVKKMSLIGKVLNDLIVAVNIYALGDIETYNFLYIFYELTDNRNIEKIVIDTMIDRFLAYSKAKISNLSSDYKISEAIKDPNNKICKHLCDFWHNLLFWVLFDCGRISTVFHIFGYFFEALIWGQIKNKADLKKKVLIKASEIIKRNESQYIFKEIESSSNCTVQVFFHTSKVFEQAGETLKQARSIANLAIYTFILLKLL